MSGRGGRGRKSYKQRREQDWQEAGNRGAADQRTNERKSGDRGSGRSSGGKNTADSSRFDKNRGVFFDRLKWVPPELSTEPIPTPECPYCGKNITDMAAALMDRDSKKPVHFDCLVKRIMASEVMEEGDTLSYIGGGRFGVVHFAGQNGRGDGGFKIKKILEWENKDERAIWRKDISDHYSLT